MAEAILFNLASKVVEKIGSPALREVGLAWSLEDELKTLEARVLMIKAVLVDADQKQQQQQGNSNLVISLWLERLEAAFYEADNVLDEFHYEALRRKVQLMRIMNHRSIGIQKLVRIFYSCSHTLDFRFKFKMSRRIEKIRKKLEMIVDDRTKFHPIVTKDQKQTGTDHKAASTSLSSNANESEFVGRDNDRARMHEIIHDLAVFMANGECLSTANYRSGSIFERVKHVSLFDCDCSGKEGVTKSLFELENLRTILFPFQGVGAGDNQGFVNRCISKFKYLHVLDFSNSCLKVLPDSIGNLKHLRFLDLSGNANIETLPNAVCKLYNLQTLRIWNCVKIRELPKKIGNLISLRHLYLTTQQSCLPEKEIQRLTSLRSFHIIGCENLTYLPEEMQLLTALTTVTIAACPNLTSLPNTLQKLANLRNLEISKCPNLNLAGWEDFRGLRRLQ
ncbi:putative disease resistance protein RGA4 [Camellia lanceoleosa]|uniref:Disease resistance protein RGA4 n=1 Tax=Camellia lanceoleosa TaxID=1840588 RepID=A0ACC0G5K4_9ERIC|nr:putative disease resistance protein RGA4 [Camellia lanceoleosa]